MNFFKKIIYGSAFCLLISANSRAQVSGSPSSLPDIKFHLTARPWQPINLNKNEYLDKVEGVVRQIAKYQNSSGAIVDPYSYSEVQYSTPYFAYALGALINSGRAADLLNKGIYAMEHATLDFSHGADSIPDDHGEFYLAPLAGAMAFYTPYISSAQLKSWQTRLSTPLAKIARGRTHNWRTYAMKGEWARAKNGYVNKDSAITWIEDSWINTQKPRFDNNQWKFYHDETSDPDSWTYEIAARGNLLAMIGDGYSGSSLADIYNILSLGARASLLTQDPSGQSPASGRTSNHTWNDIVQGNSFLTMADFENTKGNKRLAGQYRHAAALSFQSAQRWRQSNGLYSVTKNQFDPYERNGYATYSFLTNYNGTMMFHMAENYFKNSASIVEEPAPNEIGGYTLASDNTLATAFANAGGMEMEASLRGATDLLYSRYWSSLGVVRFARPGWDSRLGPSDGIRDDNNIGVSFAPTFLENGNWIRLASVPERYEAFFSTQFVHPLLVRCRIEYKPKVGQTGPTFTNDFTITPDLILSNLTSTTSSSNFGITWPILTFDGKTNLATNFSPNIARTAFNANSDEEAFIAVHPNPTINSSENVRRSVYGDLLPVRMVSNATNNLSLIYPRNSTDPSAESVRTSFSLSGTDFSSMLGSVNGNIYVGRTSAGGVGTSIDLDNDKVKDVTFSASCSFIMQLDKGVITNIETDKPVTATISGTPITLSAYTPYALPTTINQSAASVIASADDGNVPANTIDGDLNTRWSALGEQWIKYSFDSLFKLNSLKIAWYRGNERNYAFDVQASADGQNWGTIFTGKSAGITAGFETYAVSDTLARYVRFLVHGSNVNRWNAINEVQFSKQTKAFNTTGASILFSRTFDSVHVDQGGTGSLLEYISTTDNTPASVTLTAIDGSGNVPTWLSVNGSNLNSLLYTTGSEITFSFDATNLSVGNYSAVVTASAPGYKSGLDTISLTVDAPSTGSLANLQINFQDSVTVPPTGWLRDYGQSFGQRTSSYQGLGNVYGWIARSNNQPVDLRKNSRKRTTSSNILLATFMHMQANDAPSSSLTSIEGIWEAQVPNGNYDVTISVGDPSYNDSRHSIIVEGVNAINGFIPSSSQQFKTATVTVSVSDGILTIDAVGGFNTKINYVKVKPSASQRPSIVLVNPENAATQVSENTSISTSILKLPNGGIDNNTIISSNVFLTEETSGALVPSNVNGTGGGDAITLVPSQPLKLGTSYNFNVTAGVKDLSGAAFIPYVSRFTTGSGSSGNLVNAKFDKILMPNTAGRHSSLCMGPDGKLYALTIDGIIERYTINKDGTLVKSGSLFSLQDAYGSRQQRLAIGFAFDPASTATNLIAWVTHSSFVFLDGPEWDGRLTKLSGSNLQNVQDVLINLPRSAKDHLTNSISFGPDGKLYFTQGSTSAMGRADKTWGNRNEDLLSGCVLRLDASKLGTLPLNVKTPDGGGNYNPYATSAPLTIYASGVRNAYDLVWHSNGNLYVPTNGSAAGGNTPGSVPGTLRTDGSTYNGPVVPALSDVQQTQKDFLFRIVKGGFYGHPNPLRGEYVMNGGNPTTSVDPAQVDDYPVGTLPDANYKGFSFDFQANKSPDGVIEYKSNTFNGALKGKILVVRYSQNDDILTLTPGGTKNDIVSYTEGAYIEGFSGFVDPLDLVEDVKTGNIYVSEYGGNGYITLLRPKSTTPTGAGMSVLPLADATIRGGASGNKNYGSDTSFIVKASSIDNYLRYSYLKFPLSSVSGINAAKLRIYGSNIDDSTAVTLSCFAVNNDSWLEGTLTWNNAPASNSVAISTTAIKADKKYYEFDVTDFVKTQISGDKIASFAIKNISNASMLLEFNSRENGLNPPLLFLDTAGIPSSGPAGQSAAKTLSPLADASVRDGSYGTKNYGTDDSFLVKSSNINGYTRNAYLKFALNSLANVQSAKLRVYGNNTVDNTSITLSSYGVDNDSWTETGITWNNAPPTLPTALSTTIVNNQLKYYEFDVTSYVKAQFAGDKIATLSIKNVSSDGMILSFHSKENALYRPQLVVQVDTSSQTLTAYSQVNGPLSLGNDKGDTATNQADNLGIISLKEKTDEKNDFEKPRIYPNPLHSKFNIEFPPTYQGNFTLQIVDGGGRVYDAGKVRLRGGGYNLEVNIAKLKLKPGVYYLRLYGDKGNMDIIKILIHN